MSADRCDLRDAKSAALISEQLKGEWYQDFFSESFSQAFFMCVKLNMCGSEQ